MRFSVPKVQRVPDGLTPEGVVQGLVVLEEDVFLADDEDDLEGFEFLDELGVMEVGDILAGHVVVDILVAEAVEEIVKMLKGDGEVIAAAEADDLMEEMGIFEGEVGGVPGAEAATCGNGGGAGVFVLNEAENFGQDIFFILEVPEDPFSGVKVFGIEAFIIDAVEAIYLDGTGFDLPAEGLDHLPVFVVIEAGGAGREEEDGVSGVAEYEQFHIAPEVRAKPFMVFPVHVVCGDRYCRMIPFHNV
jgi:hypothetical protein